MTLNVDDHFQPSRVANRGFASAFLAGVPTLSIFAPIADKATVLRNGYEILVPNHGITLLRSK
jgi:hypothetical protein